ncbi:MAG: 7-carboxy-7-deazaguanine synthase QueE [bacterium]|nr:7-carboxy-7-deazaguanine synthase QueE [bacterium]
MIFNAAEVFSSIQGEGLYAGVRQVFLRLSGCNLRCRYCDTPETREVPSMVRIERKPAGGEFDEYPNPITIDHMAEMLLKIYGRRKLHHSLSITGGEPLLQADALMELLPHLRDEGVRIYLETNGTLPDAMRRLAPVADIVAMDIKLETAAGVKVPHEVHRRFIEEARGTNLFLKMVITAGTDCVEFMDTVKWLSEFAVDIPLVLQPVTPFGDIRGWLPPQMLITYMDAASEILETVRAIPQMHKLLGQL